MGAIFGMTARDQRKRHFDRALAGIARIISARGESLLPQYLLKTPLLIAGFHEQLQSLHKVAQGFLLRGALAMHIKNRARRVEPFALVSDGNRNAHTESQFLHSHISAEHGLPR